MSYGVVASRSVSVMVQATDDPGLGGAPMMSDSEVVLDRFQSVWGGAWVSGRLTLTRLHVNFIPSRGGRGMAMMDLALRDIEQVELAGGRLSRLVVLRTPSHVVHVRSLASTGLTGLATSIADLAEAAKRRSSRRM